MRQRYTTCQVRQRCTACLQATDAIGKMIRVAVEPAIGTMSDDPLPKLAVVFYTFYHGYNCSRQTFYPLLKFPYWFLFAVKRRHAKRRKDASYFHLFAWIVSSLRHFAWRFVFSRGVFSPRKDELTMTQISHHMFFQFEEVLDPIVCFTVKQRANIFI